MPIDELNDLLERELPEGDWDTVGGFLLGLLGHVPEPGEVVEATASGPSPSRRSRVVASARYGSETIRTGSRSTTTTTRDVPFGFRHVRRSAQRGEVHAAQPHPRHEGLDRLRQAADDAHPGARRAQPARRAGRVRRHAGHPQAAHRARRAAQRDRQRGARRRRRGVPRGRRHDAARAGRPVRRRAACPTTRSSW